MISLKNQVALNKQENKKCTGADLNGTQLVAGSTYTYEAKNRLDNLTHSNATSAVAFYNFEYDSADRITQISDVDGTTDYNYDLTNQLTGANHTDVDNPDESYSYDGNGNRISSSVHGSGYVTGGNNRLQTDGIYNYEYDAEGNRTKRVKIATGEVTEYSWDYRNRLIAAVTKNSSGGIIKSVEYVYDVFDRRIGKEIDGDGAGPAAPSVERLVYDGEHIALTFDGSGNQTHRYLHGPVIDQILADESASGQVLWALTDNQGTVRDLVNEAGALQNHLRYDSFGKVTGETNPNLDFRFGYTGRELDEETGLSFYRARYYDAGVGRFISEDPIGFAGGDVNLYRYVGNSPTNDTDPSGEFAIPLAVIPVAAIAFAGIGILYALDQINRSLNSESLNPFVDTVPPQPPEPLTYPLDPPGSEKNVIPTPNPRPVPEPLPIPPFPGPGSGLEQDGGTHGGICSAPDRLPGFGEGLEQPSPWDSIFLAQHGDTGKNAKELRQNMQDAGVIFNPGDEAHHIVASTHRRAQEARDILDRYGIDINDANNGIPLPNHLHHGRGLHSYRGIDEVRIRLRAATSRDEAIEILTQISDEIRSGTFPTQS